MRFRLELVFVPNSVFYHLKHAKHILCNVLLTNCACAIFVYSKCLLVWYFVM